jgi:hypothetical protein
LKTGSYLGHARISERPDAIGAAIAQDITAKTTCGSARLTPRRPVPSSSDITAKCLSEERLERSRFSAQTIHGG